MTETADLDVVVLGGAGHVGLPLSLVLADSGARVGIFDLDTAKLGRLMAGEMPFMESGADELLARVLATVRLEVSA
ncbi:MAG: nucleotide sugar dehydrogenase, partial [Chloroflexi bacterium]|nr:nucleotide sugar dehydrogenase [Chloroflexota bacterium]